MQEKTNTIKERSYLYQDYKA